MVSRHSFLLKLSLILLSGTFSKYRDRDSSRMIRSLDILSTFFEVKYLEDENWSSCRSMRRKSRQMEKLLNNQEPHKIAKIGTLRIKT